MEDQHLLQDHLKELEEIRQRKTQYLDPKLTLEILRAWGKEQLQIKQEATEEENEVPFKYPTQIVWIYTGEIEEAELTKIVNSPNAKEELYRTIFPLVKADPHLISYALSQVEWRKLIKRLKKEQARTNFQ